MIYKNMVKDGIPHEEAEKRAIRAKLPEKYQKECVSHIACAQLPMKSDCQPTESI